MSVFLIAVIVVLYTLQSLFCRLYTARYPGKKEDASPVFAVVTALFVGLVSLVIAGIEGNMAITWPTLLLGLANAVTLALYDNVLVKASQNGSYAVLMTFCLSGGILIPTVVENFFGGHTTIWVWLCMALVVLATYLSSYQPANGQKSKTSFYVYCLLLGLANGAYGSLLKRQEQLTGESEKTMMVAITFLGAALLSFGILLRQRKKETPSAFKQSKISAVWLFACAAVSAAAIHFLVFLLPLVNVDVLYTFDNAGVLVLSVLAAAVLFKEKISRINLIGLILMCLALLGISPLFTPALQKALPLLFR